jgi:hypothetical protein
MEENIPTTNQQPTSEVKKPSSLPPRKTIILIVALILITVGLVYLSISSMPQGNQQTGKPQAAVDFAQTNFELSSVPILDPASSTSAVPVYYLSLDMTTGQNKVTAVQIELQYDPAALTNVDIVPAEKSQGWTELIKKVDAENGVVSYALGITPGQKGVSGSGPVAKLTFSKTYGFSEQTRISFLPKTMATAESYDKSVLKTSTGTLFSFPEGE